MAIYSLYLNSLCRIEVRFSPGIPRIEILGSSAKSVKDAAIKAKLLLQQQGFRFPRNKKIYVCIDPFICSKQGLDLAIYVAMKNTLLEESKDYFVYGDLSFDGTTSSDKSYEDLELYIPPSMPYCIGGKSWNIFLANSWKKKSPTVNVLWNSELSPLLLAILKARLSLLLIGKKTEEIVKNLRALYYHFHQDLLPYSANLHLKKSVDSSNGPFIASTQICPCNDIEKWQRKSCAYTQKQCHRFFRSTSNKIAEADFIFVVEDKDFSLTTQMLDLTTYPLPTKETLLAITARYPKVLQVLHFLPTEEQERWVNPLCDSMQYHQNLL